MAIEGGNPLTVVNKGYGWKPGLPDIRDYRLNFSGAEAAPEVDLRKTGYAAQTGIFEVMHVSTAIRSPLGGIAC